LSREQMRAVVDGLLDWAKGGPIKATRKLLDWLQAVAPFLGYRCDVQRDGVYFELILTPHQATEPATLVAIRQERKEKVYCYSVPSGFLVVRRNGHVFVSGNSGKSVGCLSEIIIRALKTPPGKDGVRRSRCLVGRRTYAQLKSTTINTFKEWYGPLGQWRFDSPITWTADIGPLPDGTSVHLEVATRVRIHCLTERNRSLVCGWMRTPRASIRGSTTCLRWNGPRGGSCFASLAR